jgi:outer membrane protein OmpA-like peptidoglycan-associated protein
MTRHHGIASIGVLPLIVLTILSTTVFAQTVKINGLIKGRSGATMIVQTSDSPTLIVVLTDSTQVGQIQGVLKARRKEMSMAALIPGLAVQVEGTYNEQKQLVAKSVKFKGNDLKQAQSIQAGLHETKARTQQNEEELEAQKAALQGQQEQLAAQQEKISANKTAIDAAIARFGQLDDYYILDEVSVYFGNGKVAVDPKFTPQLTQLAEKAKTVEAYMIQVIGYASSVGSVELNQKLSEDRAHNVANFLVQQANIPLTNLLAPGAMGESRSGGDDSTAEGQAENRRVVVRILQNKGIAALKSSGP